MDKFLHFDSTDLALEQSFINWVNASDVTDINLWNKWIADHPEKRETIAKAKLLVTSIKFQEENVTPGLEDKIWNNINAATSSNATISSAESTSGIFPLIKKWVPLAAAAIIALLIYVNISSGSNYETQLKTQLAENIQELLPDGSIVDINAQSEVSYSKSAWKEDRVIELEGEAYFSVKKGSKFTVVTDNGNVEVLGTSFNVFSRGDIFSVECETGKVSVTSNGKEVILTPNESVKINLEDNEVFKTEINKKRSAWRRGTFNYKDVKINEVLADIERHFDTKINVNDFTNIGSYTGDFNSATNVDSVLHKVCWPLGLEVTKSGENYQVSSSKK